MTHWPNSNSLDAIVTAEGVILVLAFLCLRSEKRVKPLILTVIPI